MTAKIVVVFNQKGGCSKTMDTMQIGGTWGLMGLRVCIIDMDPQNTASVWKMQESVDNKFPAELLNYALLKEGFVHKLQALVDKFDVIIIDCPPAMDSPVPWTALLTADYAVIPVIPVMDNVWASKVAEDLIHAARKARAEKGIHDELGATYLLSVVRRGKIFDTCLKALEKDTQLPIMSTKIGMRNAYPECQIYGCCVGQFGASDAKTEIEAVATELASNIGINIKKNKGTKK